MGRPGGRVINTMQRVVKSYENELTDLLFGVVTGTSPLTIRVDNKFEVSRSFLLLTSNVIDHQVAVTSGDQSTTITIKNGLSRGEKVMLLRVQLGQKYIVLDRIR